MRDYFCHGDQAFESDTASVVSDMGCLRISIREDSDEAMILISDKDKVKEIARVLVAYLQGET